MKRNRVSFALLVYSLLLPLSAQAQRTFVSAQHGSDANPCSVTSPCRTFTAAIAAVPAGGEVVVLDSGGFGAVTITQPVTIAAPAGVHAGIHVASGDAITVSAPGIVTLRGLVMNGGPGNGIAVNSVGTLNVENCSITGFVDSGIKMLSGGELTVKGTDIAACTRGIAIENSSGLVQASIDHCHLDGNTDGFYAATTSPGTSTTTATYTTANHNLYGWICGNGVTNGKDILNLEYCTGSEGTWGLAGFSTNAQSVARYSNCIFANNTQLGVQQANSVTIESRGNNTITGNALGPTSGTIGSFSPI